MEENFECIMGMKRGWFICIYKLFMLFLVIMNGLIDYVEGYFYIYFRFFFVFGLGFGCVVWMVLR